MRNKRTLHLEEQGVTTKWLRFIMSSSWLLSSGHCSVVPGKCVHHCGEHRIDQMAVAGIMRNYLVMPSRTVSKLQHLTQDQEQKRLEHCI